MFAKFKLRGAGSRTGGCRGKQQPGTSLAIIMIVSSSSGHVQSPASPPLQTQTLWGQGLWTWPCGPQENVHLDWAIIWDLFGRRPCLRQNYVLLSWAPLCSQGTSLSRRINTLFYSHLRNPKINTTDWHPYSLKYFIFILILKIMTALNFFV